MAEQEFRRAMTISNGDLMIFLTKPISLALLVIACGGGGTAPLGVAQQASACMKKARRDGGPLKLI